MKVYSTTGPTKRPRRRIGQEKREVTQYLNSLPKQEAARIRISASFKAKLL